MDNSTCCVYRTTVKKEPIHKFSYKLYPYIPRSILVLSTDPICVIIALLDAELRIGFARFSIPCHGHILFLLEAIFYSFTHKD